MSEEELDWYVVIDGPEAGMSMEAPPPGYEGPIYRWDSRRRLYHGYEHAEGGLRYTGHSMSMVAMARYLKAMRHDPEFSGTVVNHVEAGPNGEPSTTEDWNIGKAGQG